MDKQKQYIIVLSVILVSVIVSLSALKETRLEVYFSLFTVCYFGSSALFRPRRKMFDFLGVILFFGFCYIVLVKVLDILR
jgi:hypothetical protein